MDTAVMGSFGIMESVKTWYGALLMGGIAIMSIYMVALAVVRFRFFSSIRVDSQHLLQEIHQALESNDTEYIGKFRGQRAADPPIRILLYTGLANRHLEGPELQELLKVTLVKQR
jgi:hypothetical protein